MSRLIGWIDKHFYPGWGDNWDDGLFRKAILAHLQPEHIVLDLGAGAGIASHMNFRGIAAEVCGVDPDPRVLDNPFLDEGIAGSGEAVPYPDSRFDIVFANNVLEHIADPVRVFKEVHRVLKPGGWFLAKTPNRYHYVSMIGRITPHWFHTLIARQRDVVHRIRFPHCTALTTAGRLCYTGRETAFGHTGSI